jgi:TfoX/Sxy family transcriptional regulator of competence genes
VFHFLGVKREKGAIMAYDKVLAERVQTSVQHVEGLTSKKMFGGIGYMINGNMAVGVYKDHLIVRVGLDDYDSLLAEPFARVFDITGRVMKGWIMVDSAGLAAEGALKFWINKGIAYASSLPPKN